MLITIKIRKSFSLHPVHLKTLAQVKSSRHKKYKYSSLPKCNIYSELSIRIEITMYTLVSLLHFVSSPISKFKMIEVLV